MATEQLPPHIGRGLPEDDVEDIGEFIKDAVPNIRYRSNPDMDVIYEILEKDGWEEKVSAIATRWVSDEENLSRACKHVGREPRAAGPALVLAYCMFRLKSFTTPVWKEVEGRQGVPNRGQPDRQTVVFIALTDLDPSNGFCQPLKRGEDICMDARAPLRFPPTGGGLGIFICLDI